MIIDSSAIVAVLRDEPNSSLLRRAIVYSDRLPKMASANFLETAIVVDGRGDPASSRRLDESH